MLLAYTDVQALGVNLSQRTLRRLEQSGEFPRRLKIGRQKVAWIEREINEWLQTKLSER